MKNSQVPVLLFAAIVTMAVIPLMAALYFLDHSLQTGLNLGFNQEIVRTLDAASQNLKQLKLKDPQNEDRYRQQFEEVENLKMVYSKPDLVRNNVADSLKIYFGLGLVTALLMSVTIAALLSRKIASSYKLTFEELTKQKETVRYLEEITSWQELAKMLAHEIKNPLTPIEVLITSLTKSYESKPPAIFAQHLEQTESMVREELGHLKNIVDRFSEFSKLPKVDLGPSNLAQAIQHCLQGIQGNYEGTKFDFICPEGSACAIAEIDPTLFRQVFANIIRNGIEANPGKPLRFKVGVSTTDDQCRIEISNNGTPVPKEIAGRIFDPYISGKTGKDNMGLGLAIVKKIIIEHGGEIFYVEETTHPKFVITLRRIS